MAPAYGSRSTIHSEYPQALAFTLNTRKSKNPPCRSNFPLLKEFLSHAEPCRHIRPPKGVNQLSTLAKNHYSLSNRRLSIIESLYGAFLSHGGHDRNIWLTESWSLQVPFRCFSVQNDGLTAENMSNIHELVHHLIGGHIGSDEIASFFDRITGRASG
ncbi:hypothetical protein VNO77_37893 [Canavalia gladiata]|uniref:Uncharacterized protein n=1 Tax=Canavalia gladiata TaxID=3824 RepID=A0AAN9KBU5_CANGL